MVSTVLRVAEQQHVIGKNGIASWEIGKSPRHADLVALINPRIALDGFHERAGFALLGGAALAEAAAIEPRLELLDGFGKPREIVLGKIVGIQRQVGFDPFKAGDDAGERAHVLAVTRDGGPRRHASVAAAGHDQLATGVKFDRRRRSAWVAQLLVAASRTLRAGRHVVLDDGRARQVEAHDVVAQLRAKIGCDGAGDLDRRKLDRALPERMPHQRRNGDAAGLPAVEQPLDLAIADHAIGKAHPAGAVARAQHRADQGSNARGLDQHPGCAVRQVLPVQFRQSCFEVIVDQGDGQIGGTLHDAHAQCSEGSAELLGAVHVDRLNAHPALVEIFRCRLGRQPEACPIAGRGVRGRACARRRNHIAAVDQPLQGFLDLVGWKMPPQFADELTKALAAFADGGGKGTIKLAV